MKYYLLLLVALLFSSCNLFKNTHSSLKESHQENSSAAETHIHEDKNLLSKSAAITWRKDTGNLNYVVQLWPKGNFTFSPEHGFSGEAAQILMTGITESSSTVLNQNSNHTSDKGKVDMKLSQTKKLVSDQKAKTKISSPSWKWVIGGLVLLLIGCGIAYVEIKHLKII